MLNIIAAFLVFGLIILIHEFGHFLLAKINGIGVVEFSLGMGPRLYGFQRGETTYSLKLLPFGGSCMMLGEDEEENDDKAFNNKSVWARISVIAAGPVFNFILAFLLAIVIVSAVGYDSPKVYDTIAGYPAEEAGLQPGDMIRRLNNQKITTYRDVMLYLAAHEGTPLKVVYERPSRNSGEMTEMSTMIVPEYSPEEKTYLMGLQFYNIREKPTSPAEILYYSAYEVEYCIRSTFTSLGMLFRRQVAVGEAVAGPVRIVTMIGGSVGESREIGISSVFLTLSYWGLLLSASLGIMNLLPIPALDGGRLVFLIIEALRGRPINREKEGMVHMAGMMLLMALMVLVLFNDIRNLF